MTLKPGNWSWDITNRKKKKKKWSCSVVSNCLQLHVACQAPPSMGFSRQEYWSRLPLPSPGNLPDPGVEPGSPALQADSLPSEQPGTLLIIRLQTYSNFTVAICTYLNMYMCACLSYIFPCIDSCTHHHNQELFYHNQRTCYEWFQSCKIFILWADIGP